MNRTVNPQVWGIEAGYHDVFGNWHQAEDQTLVRLEGALSAGRSGPAAVASVPHADLRAFQGDGSRCWGLAVQLYSVRSARNWGIGDFTDLRSVIEVAAQSGAAAVGLNPLHALFLDRAEAASPYAPNSRLFLNPLYIDVSAVPEFAAIPDAQPTSAIEALRAVDLVDYAEVASVKERSLRQAYDRFLAAPSSQRRESFERFRAEQGEKLVRFSCFEVLHRRFAKPWQRWTDPWRSPSKDDLVVLREQEALECGFFEFLQWISDEQLAACKERARDLGLTIGLYLDLAVGVDPDGADAWSNQTAVLSDFSVGAPPDEFNPDGQDWGLAPLNPHALPDNDFSLFRELLAANMRHAGALRLDHVLGLMRLFLVPHGMPASQGAYVRYPFEALLRVVAEESNRYRCIFIGEDLGTVPSGFRETATRWGVWTYRVMIFERSASGEFKSPSEYPFEALATFTTHDLPNFGGWISCEDIRTKHTIGVNPGEDEASRRRALEALQRALSQAGCEMPADNFAAPASFLATSHSRLVVVSAEDMLDVVEQVNIPGTTDQHPNWRRKLPVPVEKWSEGRTWQDVTTVFEAAGRSARG